MVEKPLPSGYSEAGMPARWNAQTRVLDWSQEPISKVTSGTESGIDTSITSGTSVSAPSIERGRYTRAVTEDMTTERVADHFCRVHSQSGNIYQSDLRTGACTCPDCQKRGDRYVCKHAIRASLVEIIANSVTTRTVAPWRAVVVADGVVSNLTVNVDVPPRGLKDASCLSSLRDRRSRLQSELYEF